MSHTAKAIPRDVPALQLKQVRKKIGGKTIVDSLSFDISKGEVFGFLGPNGAGKTTTIRMIVGLISLSGGQILIDGINVVKQPAQAKRKIGAIVENPEMYKFLTGYQNLVHYARMVQGVSRARIQEVIDLVGLAGRIHHKVKTYSLGMRQRLGVAQALLHKPSLLILDEPTNGLDPAGIRELRDYLKKLAHEDGVTVIVSSHLLTEMELMCDRIAIIQQGKLIDIQAVNGHEKHGQQVRFEVDDAAKAAWLVEQKTELSVSRGTDYIEVAAAREDIPQITRLLTGAQIDVYQIASQRQSLEDRFLQITGSETQ